MDARQTEMSAVFRLGGCLIGVVVLWGGVFPWIASCPRPAARLDWLRAHQINTNAMFYTELETWPTAQDGP